MRIVAYLSVQKRNTQISLFLYYKGNVRNLRNCIIYDMIEAYILYVYLFIILLWQIQISLLHLKKYWKKFLLLLLKNHQIILRRPLLHLQNEKIQIPLPQLTRV